MEFSKVSLFFLFKSNKLSIEPINLCIDIHLTNCKRTEIIKITFICVQLDD